MIPGSIARRYAKALFSLAVEKGRIEVWSDSLLALGRAVDGSPELRDVLQNPAYTRETRAAVVAQLAAAIQLDTEPAALLQLLGERNRLSGLSAIVAAFRELGDVEQMIDVIGQRAVAFPRIERPRVEEPLRFLPAPPLGFGVLVRLNQAHSGCIVPRDEAPGMGIVLEAGDRGDCGGRGDRGR